MGEGISSLENSPDTSLRELQFPEDENRKL